jgi:DNA-binding PadR family transcriptional regulator
MKKSKIATNKFASKSASKSTFRSVPKHIELRGFLSFFILHELNDAALAGDELASIIGGRKNTVLTPGTIYPALKRLRRQKLVLYRRKGRKKIYYLTDQGKRELKALYFVFSEFFSGFKKKMK